MTCIKHESDFAGLKNKKGWTPAEKGERGDNKAWTILYSPNTSSHYFNMGGFRAFESVVQRASIHTRASFLIAWWQGGRLMMQCWGPVSAVGPLGFAMYWTSGWGSVDAAAATSAAVAQPAAAIGLTRIGCWWGEPRSLLEWSDLGGAKNKFCIYSWDMQGSQDLKKKIKIQSYSPTIRCPSSVLKRTICIFMLLPLTEAKTPSTLVHTLRTEPHRTKYVRQRSPISHCSPTDTFLQFPRLCKNQILLIHLLH